MTLHIKSFIKERLNREVFTGLPLTILIIIILILLGTFIGITNLIVDSAPIVKIDTSFAQFLYRNRTASLASIFYAITSLANQLTIVLLLAIVIIYLYYKKEHAYLYSLCVTVLGAEASVYLIKIFINRSRPALDITYYIEKSQSFPSGHSTIAMAFFGFVSYYLLGHISGKNKRSIILFFSVLLIFLIGFSRLYLVVHYLSDVIGGFLIGGLWLLAGIIFREHHFYNSSLKKGKS